MPSIIPGFEYDIFISYRQKDNKYDGWVTEFIDHLKKEIEATFKEDVSIYFDENPSDGLLETHSVDKSLENKLRCLIFIPIISQTYCDPKSFAWQHEFVVFNKMAREDQFGRDIKLIGGNVASRIIPVKIHEIDATDNELLENELGCRLRSIEFIYKSAGVNRPLKPSDNPDKNLNKTFYRDQINKVANAVKEIIHCLHPDIKKQIGQQEHAVIELPDYSELVPDSPVSDRIDRKSSGWDKEKFTAARRTTILLSIMLVLAVIAGLWGWLRSHSESNSSLTTYSAIPVETSLMDGFGCNPYFSLSPDGRTIAYSSGRGIQLRTLSDFSAKVLEGTKGTGLVAFSPDGQSLVFAMGGKIYKIGINGSPISLIYTGRTGVGLSWGIDGYIYFSPESGRGIRRISVNGGEPQQMTTVIDSLGECAHTLPQLLPDSKTLLFTAIGPSGGSLDSRIVVQQLNHSERRMIIDKAISGHYLSNGNLIFADNEGTISTVPFDIRKLKITGEPATVISGVHTGIWGGAAFISISETGNLIFLPRNVAALNVLSVVDRSGKIIEKDSIPSKTIERMGHGWHSISISRAGNFLSCNGRSFGSSDIWRLNLDNGDSERITFDPSQDQFPVWSPDGNAIAYSTAKTGTAYQLFIKDFRSAGKPHLIRTWPWDLHFTSWSPDGKWLAANDYTSTNGTDCYIISVDSGDSISISASQANEDDPQFSPFGRWLAYASDESGQFEIYVVSFPKMESKRQVSEDGGWLPRWDKSGEFIYYLSHGYVIAQPVETDQEFKRGTPVRLFQANASDFNVSPDGQKFYLRKWNTKRPNPPLNLITNWFEELKTKTGK